MTLPTPANDNVRLVSKKIAAAYCGVSSPTFSKWVTAGWMPPAMPLCGKFDLRAIDAVLDKMSGIDQPRFEDSFDVWKRARDAKRPTRH